MAEPKEGCVDPQGQVLRIEHLRKAGPSHVISIRCHACKQLGTFEHVNNEDLFPDDGVLLGQRRCPNPACHAHVFFVHRHGQALLTYPAERIEFDTSAIPPKIVAALEEAITCHAGRCYKAGGMMVRKALEELCEERKARGRTLKARIKALRKRIVLPTDLLDGIDDLRLLGNDAAHVKSRTYDDVGEKEVAVAIKFTKEVLKAAYQYSALREELRALKKNHAGAEGE